MRIIKKLEVPENVKILSLIDDWLIQNGKGNSYENVLLELLNGDSFLYAENFIKYELDENYDSNFKLGVYEIEEKKFLKAFTDLNLLTNQIEVKSNYVKLNSKDFLKMADKLDVDGIVLNNKLKNMFVVFRNKNL